MNIAIRSNLGKEFNNYKTPSRKVSNLDPLNQLKTESWNIPGRNSFWNSHQLRSLAATQRSNDVQRETIFNKMRRRELL